MGQTRHRLAVLDFRDDACRVSIGNSLITYIKCKRRKVNFLLWRCNVFSRSWISYCSLILIGFEITQEQKISHAGKRFVVPPSGNRVKPWGEIQYPFRSTLSEGSLIKRSPRNQSKNPGDKFWQFRKTDLSMWTSPWTSWTRRGFDSPLLHQKKKLKNN